MMREFVAAAVGAGALLLLAFSSGYRAAEWRFEHDRAVAAAQQGAKDYEKLRKAMDVQDSLRVDLQRARAESDRVRRALDAARAASASRNSSGAGVTGCESLLRDGVELLSDCRARLLECAGKHDSLVEAVN